MHKIKDDTGKLMMQCGHCDKLLVTRNATKLLYHAAKKRGGDIKICEEVHPEEYRKLYEDLFAKHVAKQIGKNAHKRQVRRLFLFLFLFLLLF